MGVKASGRGGRTVLENKTRKLSESESNCPFRQDLQQC